MLKDLFALSSVRRTCWGKCMVLCCCCWINGGLLLSGQDLSQFQHFSTSDGLPSNQIIQVQTDGEGFVWVLTRTGLARFDGRRFLPFSMLRPGADLPQKGYAAMLTDGQDLLWLGTTKGLYCISLATFEVRFFEKDFRPACTDAQGDPWFTCNTGIVCFRNGGFQEFPLFQNGAKAPVYHLACGRGNTLLVKGEKHFYRFDIQAQRYTLLEKEGDQLIPALYMASDANGMCWLSLWYVKTNGLVYYDPYQDRILRRLGTVADGFTSTDINAILPDGDKVWLATNSGGFCWYVISENRFYAYPPDDKNPNGLWPRQITAVFKDNFGNLWVGTLFGLYMAPAKAQTTRLLAYTPYNPNSLVSRPVTALRLITDDLLAIGTMNGLSLYDRQRGTFFNLHLPLYNNNPYNDQVRDFAPDTPESFWVASWSGLSRLDIRTGRILEYYITHPNAGENHPEVLKKQDLGAAYRLCRDREGVLWFSGFGGGLTRISGRPGARRFDQLHQQEANHALLRNRVEALLDFDARYMLLGTADGLLYYDRSNGQLKSIAVEFPGLTPPLNVSSLARSRLGDILVIVNNQPFRMRWAGDKASATPVKGPLALTACQQLIEDNEGAIWLTQEDGVVQVDEAKNAGRLYDARHYLLDNVLAVRPPFQPVKDRDGNLYIGGSRGVTVLDPARFAAHSGVPCLKITGLKVNGETFCADSAISRLKTLYVSWSQSNLGFEFSVLNAAVPALCRYAYSLDGGKKVDLGTQSTVNFSNLSPGTYQLRVTAANSDGVWDETGVALRIVVRPPWWRSPWAYLAYALLVGGAVYWAYQFRLRQRLAQQEALQLREMDAFKSRFFTNITHEFRTPLTVILGMAEQLAPPEGAASNHPLSLIRRNGENLLRLINQILDLSKLENKALKINYKKGDVLAYLRYITESLHSLAATQHLTLQLESDQKAIVMDYDPDRLLQMVYNLLSNAIKFTPAGGQVTLRVTVDGGRSRLVIRVVDTGTGIPAEALPYLFDRFFQAGNQALAKAGGTGIGLSLTRELVRAMGGEISAESPAPETGRGAAFTVVLPVRDEAGVADVDAQAFVPVASPPLALPAPDIIAVPADAGDAGSSRLLLIEDNPDVMTYVMTCLQGEYQIDCAYNGQQGIDKALETVPDLILSDVMMPAKDGLEVCDALKNDERTSHIPIVLLTAKADVESRIAGLRRGADVYLSKPFHREELRLTLANLLARRRTWQERFARLGLGSPAFGPTDLPPTDTEIEDAFLQKIRQHLEQHLGDAAFDGPRLARAMHLSEVQLYRKIKALTGKSTAIYIRSIRLHKGLELLRTTSRTVSEIAYDVGFEDPNYFSRTFSQEFGMAPSEARK